jgi:hypothetical protein
MSLPSRKRKEQEPTCDPLAPENLPEPRPPYLDGTYLICGAGEANLWAVCDRGRWGVVYELEDIQLLAAWVEVDDVPLHVLLDALNVPGREATP